MPTIINYRVDNQGQVKPCPLILGQVKPCPYQIFWFINARPVKPGQHGGDLWFA